MKIKFLILAASTAAFFSACKDTGKDSNTVAKVTVAKDADIPTTAEQQAITPKEAFERLKAGNDRFVNDKEVPRDLMAEKTKAATGQFPFAIVLGCMDSRVAPEIIMDESIGDIFDIRVAGNTVNDEILGSMEYGVEHAGAKLIAIIGHSSCGAVKGACDNVKEGNLTKTLAPIATVLPKIKVTGEKSSKNPDYVAAVAKANVYNAIESIKKRSPLLAHALAEGKIGIVGGMYDLASGKIDFYEDSFELGKPMTAEKTKETNKMAPAKPASASTKPTDVKKAPAYPSSH